MLTNSKWWIRFIYRYIRLCLFESERNFIPTKVPSVAIYRSGGAFFIISLTPVFEKVSHIFSQTHGSEPEPVVSRLPPSENEYGAAFKMPSVTGATEGMHAKPLAATVSV